MVEVDKEQFSKSQSQIIKVESPMVSPKGQSNPIKVVQHSSDEEIQDEQQRSNRFTQDGRQVKATSPITSCRLGRQSMPVKVRRNVSRRLDDRVQDYYGIIGSKKFKECEYRFG